MRALQRGLCSSSVNALEWTVDGMRAFQMAPPPAPYPPPLTPPTLDIKRLKVLAAHWTTTQP